MQGNFGELFKSIENFEKMQEEAATRVGGSGKHLPVPPV